MNLEHRRVSCSVGEPTTTSERKTKFCVNCGAEIDARAEICPKCGVRVAPPPSVHVERKSEGIAAVCSFVFVGLGQIYNGQIGKGILFVIIGILLVFTMLLLIGFILYPIFWAYNIYDAYDTAKKINAGLIKT